MDAAERNKLIISLIDISEDIVWDDLRSFHATIVEPSKYSNLIEKLDKNSIIVNIALDGKNATLDFNKLHEKRLLEYQLQLPFPSNDYAIVKNLNSLLQLAPKFYVSSPMHYYSIEKRSSELPQEYINTIKFSALLEQISDHTERFSDIKKCYFYQGVKICIAIKYSEECLQQLSGIDELADGFERDPHMRERAKILKEIICKNTFGETEENAFCNLISRFSYIKQSFDQNWELFLNDFSLDKVLDELEVKTLSLADKLAFSLSELQKTMITIPLAVLFIAPQIDATGISSWKNILILVGIWIFHLFTLVFFWGHKRSTYFIEDELNELKEKVSREYPQIAKRVNQKFDNLQQRCSYQRNYRCIMGSLMWLMILVITFFIVGHYFIAYIDNWAFCVTISILQYLN